MTRLEQLKALVAAFEQAQQTYAKTGASDTEPDGIFQVLLIKALKGKAVTVPISRDGWELYSENEKSDEAATALHKAATACVDCILASPISGSEELCKYLEDYCWRVS